MSVLRDQKVNWIDHKKETKVEEKKEKTLTNKEYAKKLETLITIAKDFGKKCEDLYEVKKTSELYSIIVMNELNILELNKIKSKLQYEAN